MCEVKGREGDVLYLLSSICGALVKHGADINIIAKAVAFGMAEANSTNKNKVPDMPDKDDMEEIKNMLKTLTDFAGSILKE